MLPLARGFSRARRVTYLILHNIAHFSFKMAPRTRSNRVEVLARQKFLASGQTFNTTGFAALPDELYLEIISHFPA